MSETKLPTRVPLPEVPHYTEDIVFGALGLPVGFDQSELLVNLKSFDRIRKVAGLEMVSVFAAGDEHIQFDPEISSVDSKGTATVSLAGKRKKQPIVSDSLNYQGSNPMGVVGKPDVAIKVNNVEIETRIDEGGKYEKGAFDPQARAKFLNKAVIRGLYEANFSASISAPRLAIAAAQGMLLPDILFLNTPVEIIPVAGLAADLATKVIFASKSNTVEEMQYSLRQCRYSFFLGITPDRYLAGAAAIAASKLIRARK